nr:MAG TPA: hypothetical protein [Caudoviricetes sp.]
MKLILSDIPISCRTQQYIVDTYKVSKISAWRLLTGRVTHLCPGYHVKSINIADGAWDVITQSETMTYIRNMIAYQIKNKWYKRPSDFIDDVAQECYIQAYLKSGIWIEMPEGQKRAFLATLVKRTTNDYFKKHVHYTDTCKNNNIYSDNQLYPCANE